MGVEGTSASKFLATTTSAGRVQKLGVSCALKGSGLKQLPQHPASPAPLTCSCLLCKLCMHCQNAALPVGLSIACLHAAAFDKQMMCSPRLTAITASGPLQLAATASSADFGLPSSRKEVDVTCHNVSYAPGAGMPVLLLIYLTKSNLQVNHLTPFAALDGNMLSRV